MQDEALTATYGQVLTDYLTTRGEDALYRASLLSQGFVEQGLGPEEIIALHFETLEVVMKDFTYREQARAIGDAHQFLLEVMIAYGIKYKEYLELRMRDSLREAESRASLERERALDAERLDRERAEMLTEIAHELRTPLTAAMGSIDLATRDLSRGRTERVPPLLGSARAALGRLSRLSAELVQASRGEAPQLLLNQLDICALLAQACSWASSAAAEKGVTLTLEDGPDAIGVRGDPDAILSIFGNLLANAIRYTPDGGRVSVRYGCDADWCWIEIADTGIGMTPEARERIFERFYRAPEARAQDAQGLGLGLSLVQQLLVAHDGRIEVESTLGEGSLFRALLPVAAAADGGELGYE